MKQEQASEATGNPEDVSATESPAAEASGVPEEPSKDPAAVSAESAPVAPPPPTRARSWSRLAKLDVLLATGVILLGVAMATPYFLARLRRGDQPQKKPYTVEQVGAMHLRLQAADACEKGQWSVCLAKLDDAKALDPPGDGEEYVRSARTVAERMLRSDAPPGEKPNK